MGTSYTPTVQPTPQQCTPLSSSPLSPAPWPSPRWCPMCTRRSQLSPTSTRRSPPSPSSPGLEAALTTSELECLADRLERSEELWRGGEERGGLRQSPDNTNSG